MLWLAARAEPAHQAGHRPSTRPRGRRQADAATERVRAGSSMSATWTALVAELTDAARFPAVRELIADQEFAEDDDADEQFEFGLQRMLDGVALLVEARK